MHACTPQKNAVCTILGTTQRRARRDRRSCLRPCLVQMTDASSSGTPSKTGSSGKQKIDWNSLPDTPEPKRFASTASQKDQDKPPTSCAVEVHPVENKYGSFSTTFCELDPRDLYTRFKDEWTDDHVFVAPSEANTLFFSLGYQLNARGYYVGLQKITKDDPVKFVGIKYPALTPTHSASILRDVVEPLAKVRSPLPQTVPLLTACCTFAVFGDQ